MNDVIATYVLLFVCDDTRSTHIPASCDHDDVAGVKLDEVNDLAIHQVELDRVIDADMRIRIPNGASIVSHDVWDALGAESDLANFQKLVGCLLGGDSMNGEPALDIIQ